MAPRLPPPPQPNEPDTSNNARLLETVIDRSYAEATDGYPCRYQGHNRSVIF
ncbi:hypothetical protein LR48_Vigan10g063800 [Vigna angularis]|uniref:Uncharacterized protein n=1 Tax=Phaseolus angularis TaxID=3914 RepID=A0A0L9VI64_PHAAN|nr:hypothetical protein LR48_Vigan10g063800 [Vigna angularis]